MATIDGLILQALNVASADPECLKIVSNLMNLIVRKENARLRKPEEVTQMVQGIFANVTELSAAARGDADAIREGDALKEAIHEAISGTQLGAVENFINADMNESVSGMLNIHIVNSCRHMATKGVADSLFAKNLPNIAAGKVTVTIGKEKLTGDLETAKNQIARFVTGDENATYETLDAEKKNMAHLVMSMLTETTSDDVFTGSSMAFSDDSNKVPFNVVGDKTQDKGSFEVSFDKTGQLVVKHEYTKAVRMVLPEGQEPKPEDLTKPAPNGRFIKTGFTYAIKDNELKRLVKLDFNEGDTTNAEQTLESNDKKKVKNALTKLPIGFTFGKYDVSCKATFKAEMN